MIIIIFIVIVYIVDVVYICDILCIDVVMCIVYYGICRMSCIKLCYGEIDFMMIMIIV